MKKIKSFNFILVIVAIILAFSVTAFADASINIENVEYNSDSNDYVFTVQYESNDVERITLLALKGTKDGPLEEIDENILYIDQKDDQQDATKGVFNFKVDRNEFNKDTPYIYIKVGGTLIDGPKIWSDFVPVLIYGDVNDDGDINIGDINVAARYILADKNEEVDLTNLAAFPAGENTPYLIDVNGDGDKNVGDLVLIATFIRLTIEEEELPDAKFPNGKFPAYSK